MGRAEQKAESRERIVEAAARLFRARGFRETSVDDLMGEAGLTRGAFYAHFEDKVALLDAALRESFAEARRGMFERGLEGLRGAAWIDRARARYLATRHLRELGEGCAAAIFAREVPRVPEARATYTAEVTRIVDAMAARLDGPGARAEAWRLLSQWAGALMLARAVDDPRVAREVLAAVRDAG